LGISGHGASEGLYGYLWNSLGFTANEALEGARLFGLREYVSAIEPAWALFPDGVVPVERFERDTILEGPEGTTGRAIIETAYRRLSDLGETTDLGAVVLSYATQHPEEFFNDDPSVLKEEN